MRTSKNLDISIIEDSGNCVDSVDKELVFNQRQLTVDDIANEHNLYEVQQNKYMGIHLNQIQLDGNLKFGPPLAKMARTMYGCRAETVR